MIAEGNQNKIQRVYWELIAIRFLIGGIIVFAVSQLLPAFISLWLGPEYILSNTVLYLLLIIFLINIVRGVTEQFLFGFGLVPLLGTKICFQNLTDLGWDGAQFFLCLLLQGLVQFQWKCDLHPFCFGVFFHQRVTPLHFKGYSLKSQCLHHHSLIMGAG